MASDINFKQFLSALQAEGFRILYPVVNFESVKNIVLRQREILIIEDLDRMVIGDGISTVQDCKFVSFGESLVYSPEDAAAVIATKMWQDLQDAAMFQLNYYPVIFELIDEFIAQKPDNFSFMWNEPIPDNSCLKQFYSHMPDYRGMFIRNFDHGQGIDPEGTTRMFLDRQQFAMQRHRHGTTPRIVYWGCGDRQEPLGYFGSELGANLWGVFEGTPLKVQDMTGGNVDWENRPINNVILCVARVAPCF